MAHEQLKTFHLFAGAGGGILADLLLGHIPVGACEIEEYPREVLLARQRDGILPSFPIWDDIRTLDGGPWKGKVDVVCGGFPCQDISAAGKGAGIAGARSGLWGQMARFICEVSPRFVFVENSPMLTSRGLGTVLGDLAAMGYDARWCVLGACDAGAPHKRDRIWILATDTESTGTGQDKRGIRGLPKRCCARPEGMGGEAESEGWWHTDPADIHDTTSERGCSRDACRENAEDAREQRSGEGEDAGGLEEWNFKPLVGRVAHGVASRVHRLKAIGNGQVPQCAALAWRILSEGLI